MTDKKSNTSFFDKIYNKIVGKDHIAGEAAEFQPDAIYLEHQNPGFPLHIVWYSILFLLVLGLIYACVTEIDKVVVAEGKIVTTRPPLTIKPLERTVVKKVHVLPGVKVKKGDLLISFDPTFNKAELEKQREQFSSLEAQRRRLEAENTKKDFSGKLTDADQKLPVELRDDLKNNLILQKMIFDARKRYYTEKLNAYDENIASTENTYKTLTKSKSDYSERKKKTNEIKDMYADLHAKNVASKKEKLQAEIEVIGYEIQMDQLDMQIVEYSHQLMSLKSERSTFVSDWKRAIVEELVEVTRNWLAYQREITKSLRYNDLLELRAPCDAVVHEIAPFQEGSAVREAESLITLIPLDVPLEAEVDVKAKDVGLIKVGDTGRIKFDAYPFQQHGTLDGTVRYISQDAFEKGQDGAKNNPRLDAERKGSFYQVRLVMSGAFLNPKDVVMPGMRVVAEIKVGKRRIISYIINPFIKAMNESIREP
ncbi:MAG: HlyD family type I secretion periplasmic adaptor subunit [Lentisphaeria bacterium]|nr:HlyD family type I secretion periplasmic adaptor subunit [Lentisphaeria bacterium]